MSEKIMKASSKRYHPDNGQSRDQPSGQADREEYRASAIDDERSSITASSNSSKSRSTGSASGEGGASTAMTDDTIHRASSKSRKASYMIDTFVGSHERHEMIALGMLVAADERKP